MQINLLLVCTGNTCRSVMAQGLMDELIQQLGEEDVIRVQSAGVAACHGAEATEEALQVLAERGIDMGGHRTRPVTEGSLAHANLVLSMTRGQRDMIKRMYPEAVDKVFSLLEYIGVDGDIEDPIGMPQEVYHRTADKLEKILLKAAKKILKHRDAHGPNPF